MKDNIYIVDLFAEIVSDTSDYLQEEGYEFTTYFMHGHPREIVDSLNKMTQVIASAKKKYPLVALFQDFEETKGRRLDVYSEVNLNMIIATITDSKYLAAERYTVNFKPILYPIYEALLYHIRKSTYFIKADEGRIEHIKIDRLYWGRGGLFGNDSNIFNDHIDAIEIKNLNLLINNKKCIQNGNFIK